MSESVQQPSNDEYWATKPGIALNTQIQEAGHAGGLEKGRQRGGPGRQRGGEARAGEGRIVDKGTKGNEKGASGRR